MYNFLFHLLKGFFMTLFDEFFTTGLIPKIISEYSIEESSVLYVILVILSALGSTVIPYLLGSINFSIIISKKQYNEDIREFGSKNAGMTNMMRTYGKKAAVLTLVGDALKAVVAGFVGYAMFGLTGAHIAGLFCVLGHMFPIFYKFKGGKGVVTTAVSVLMCNPLVFAILILIFILIVLFTRYISLGSVMCVLLYPVLLNRLDILVTYINTGVEITALSYHWVPVVVAFLVVFKHWENIKRLMNKTENKFSFKKSKKTNKELTKEEK